MTFLTQPDGRPRADPAGPDLLAPYADARVVVVDDNAPSIALVRMALSRAGLSAVHSVSDSTRALAELRAQHPDVVLLDLHMPKIDGYRILAELQDAGDDIAVIVLTADATREATRRAFSLGARDFLTKPIDPVELTQRVRNILHAGALERIRRQRLEWVEAAADIARAIRSTSDVRAGQLLVDRSRSIAGADVAVYLGAHEAGVHAAITSFAADVEEGAKADTVHAIWALLAARGPGAEPALMPAAGLTSDRRHPLLLGGSTMIVPLGAARSAHGVLCLHRGDDLAGFMDDELDLAVDFAARVAIDLELAENEAERQEMALVEERHRIARELHDHVIQRLFAIGIHMEALRQIADPDELRNKISARVGDLNETIELIRTTIFNAGGTESTPASKALQAVD